MVILANFRKTLFLGRRLGGHVKAVFTLITFIFVFCVSATVTSFKEIPLWALESQGRPKPPFDEDAEGGQPTEESQWEKNGAPASYGTLNEEAEAPNEAQTVSIRKSKAVFPRPYLGS